MHLLEELENVKILSSSAVLDAFGPVSIPQVCLSVIIFLCRLLGCLRIFCQDCWIVICCRPSALHTFPFICDCCCYLLHVLSACLVHIGLLQENDLSSVTYTVMNVDIYLLPYYSSCKFVFKWSPLTPFLSLHNNNTSNHISIATLITCHFIFRTLLLPLVLMLIWVLWCTFKHQLFFPI